MKAYKGFDKNLSCRGFQYEQGKEYTEDKASLCNSGFHACERPLDMFAYYPPAESRYCEVELDGVSDERKDDDSKVCAKKITVGAEISIANIVKATIEYNVEHCEKSKSKHAAGDKKSASATGDQGAASATGNQGAASATGNRGAASATGDHGAASATGDLGAASATGNRGAASATGNRGAASATGDRGAASATGNLGAASATGDHGAASATGDLGAASATGNQGAASATGNQGAASATGDQGAASAENQTAVAVAWGIEGRAKGILGAHIVCAEWRETRTRYDFVGAKMARVDGKTIKANTYYTLKNGEFVEVL